jgi:hypothetical protein
MAITKDFNRQCVMSALVTIKFGDVAGNSGVDLAAIAMPPNAIVIGGAVTTKVAFNSATSDVIDVGDAVSQNRYLNDGSIHAAGIVPLVPTGYVHPGGDLTVRWVGVGAVPTAGEAQVRVDYVIVGRGEYTQD